MQLEKSLAKTVQVYTVWINASCINLTAHLIGVVAIKRIKLTFRNISFSFEIITSFKKELYSIKRSNNSVILYSTNVSK